MCFIAVSLLFHELRDNNCFWLDMLNLNRKPVSHQDFSLLHCDRWDSLRKLVMAGGLLTFGRPTLLAWTWSTNFRVPLACQKLLQAYRIVKSGKPTVVKYQEFATLFGLFIKNTSHSNRSVMGADQQGVLTFQGCHWFKNMKGYTQRCP